MQITLVRTARINLAKRDAGAQRLRLGAGLPVAVFLGLVMGAGVSGCAATPQSEEGDRRAEAAAVFGPSATSGRAGREGDAPRAESDPAAADGGWAVLLERVTPAMASAQGLSHQQLARRRVALLAQATGRNDLAVRGLESGSAVVLGSFATPDDPAAIDALRQTQATVVNGTRPFALAFLIPPAWDDKGGIPQLNLENAAAAAGRPVAYTLQVEQYDSADRSLRAQTAEDRTMELRRQGEQAFYFHGPRFSIVTVGLFGPAEWDPTFQRASQRILDVQERFPNVLLNGRPYRVTRRGAPAAEDGDFLKPFLVKVPGGSE